MDESKVNGNQGLPEPNQEIKVSNKFLSGLLVISGTISVLLGFLGVFLPLLPTTPFLLLAAFCFAKSSNGFYNWLLHIKWFGKYITNYREKKGVPLKIKVLAISFLWLTILVSAFVIVQNLFVRILLILIAIGVTIHLLLIRTLKE
ncbi:MAG: YbaN family protein [Spirochaetales bacterium]|nr:YbaN family protein [Spirochaetales bacterium]